MQFLGTIVVPGSSSANNLVNSGGTPFFIAHSWQRILIVTPAESQGFNILIGTGTGLTSDATQLNISGEDAAQFGLPTSSADLCVAIFSPGGGGSVKIYGLFGISPATG